MSVSMVARSIVAGNWKMHGSLIANQALLGAVQGGLSDVCATCVVFPPAVYLSQVSGLLRDSVIAWGAQNVSAYQSGAYTGEISAAMLQDLGCRYVLVGHSERRVLFNEDDTVIAAKFVSAQHHGITPILCVGESLAQRQQGLTTAVIAAQLNALLKLANGVQYFDNAVVAYEPVWAIGTGITATPAQAQEVHDFIRKTIAQYDVALAARLSILYGGSVKADNAAELFAMPDINGGLIGGASLVAAEFLEILKCIK